MKNKENKNILEVKNIHKTFRNGKYSIHASNNVSFNIPKGKVVGLIGESGSGKTTIGRTIMNLIYPDSGSIKTNGVELAERKLSKIQKKVLHHNIQMIFQDPYASLNPQKNIMRIVAESLTAKKDDKDLFSEFFNERKNILFLSKYSIREGFFQKYWSYKISELDFLIKKYKKVLKELNTFNIDNQKPIYDNLKSFYLKIVQIKEDAYYESISKIDKLLIFLYKNWLNEKRKILTKNHRTKIERDLHVLKDDLTKIKNNIKESHKTKEIKKRIQEAKYELKELIIENKLFISTVKKQYNNVKKNLKNKIKNLFLDKLETEDKKSYENHKFLILKPKAKINIINNLKKKKIYVDLNNLLNIVDLHHNNLLVEQRNNIGKKEFIFNKKIKEIIDNLKKENFVKKEISFKNLILNKKEEINKLEVSLLESLEKDKKRDLKTLKEEETKFIIKIEKAQALYDKALLEFLDEYKVRLHSENKQNKIKIKFLKNELNILKKDISHKEKSVIKSILSIKKFNESFHDSLKKERKWAKKEYKNYLFSIKNLILEIHTNSKILNSIKYLYGISKSLFPYFSKKKIKDSLVRQRVFETLEKVGLNRSLAYRYPHEFSGGMRQRVGIARAIISKPKLIIADEPIAALDLSIQAQIVNLLMDLKRSEDLSILFIAHDLSMIEHNSDEVIIMHLGRIVEKGDTVEVFKNPIHPYTKTLMSSIPSISKINNKFKDIKFDPKYLNDYSTVSKPKFYNISNSHFVFGTEDQIKKWK